MGTRMEYDNGLIVNDYPNCNEGGLEFSPIRKAAIEGADSSYMHDIGITLGRFVHNKSREQAETVFIVGRAIDEAGIVLGQDRETQLFEGVQVGMFYSELFQYEPSARRAA